MVEDTADDTATIYRRFQEIFNTEPVHHPLYQQMKADLDAGKRSRMAIMTDLEEAATHKRQEASSTGGGRVENISL